MIAGHAHMLILTPIAHIEHVISTGRHKISYAFHTLHRAPIAPGGAWAALAQRSGGTMIDLGVLISEARNDESEEAQDVAEAELQASSVKVC